MSMEAGAPREIAEQRKNGPACIFMAGAMGTNKGQAEIDASLKTAYGEENVYTFNSAFSSDKPNKQKYTTIADILQTKLPKEGVTLIAHSMGAGEAWKVLKEFQEKNPKYFDNPENAKKLKLKVIAAPGFFKGPLAAFKLMKSLAGGTKELMLKETNLRTVDAVNAFPPPNIAREDLFAWMRKVFPDKSHYDPDVPSVMPETYTDYSGALTVPEKQILEGIDNRLAIALRSEKPRAVRKLLLQRGRFLTPHIEKIYAENILINQAERYQKIWMVNGLSERFSD